MTAVARIPFTPHEEKTIGSLGSWMLFFAIVHVLAAIGALLAGLLGMLGAITTITNEPLIGALDSLQGMTMLALAFLLGAEAVMVIMTRASLSQMLSTDTHDQELLSTSFRRLKIFFGLELAFFALAFFLALLGGVMAFIAPERVDVLDGSDVVERLREMRGAR